MPPSNSKLQISENEEKYAARSESSASSKESTGLTIPSWVLQVLPVIALLVGTITVFAQQRADVEQLKASLVEIKTIQTQQSQQFVSKQVFEIKMLETEKYQAQLNSRLDRIETLINGLYERLPKHER